MDLNQLSSFSKNKLSFSKSICFLAILYTLLERCEDPWRFLLFLLVYRSPLAHTVTEGIPCSDP